MRCAGRIAALVCFTIWCVWCADAQAPVPEFYGFYAYYDGKLHGTYKDAGTNNYPSNVEFVIFAQRPQKIDFYFLPPEKVVSGTNPSLPDGTTGLPVSGQMKRLLKWRWTTESRQTQ